MPITKAAKQQIQFFLFIECFCEFAVTYIPKIYIGILEKTMSLNKPKNVNEIAKETKIIMKHVFVLFLLSLIRENKTGEIR